MRRIEQLQKLMYATKAIRNTGEKLLRAWILVPSGILVILVACFGADTFFKHFGVSFPASVACMLLLFSGLCLCDLVIGGSRTKHAVAIIDVPVSQKTNPGVD